MWNIFYKFSLVVVVGLWMMWATPEELSKRGGKRFYVFHHAAYPQAADTAFGGIGCMRERLTVLKVF